MNVNLLNQLTIRSMKKSGVGVQCGSKHSVKCQYAQIENIVRAAIEEMKERLTQELQASHERDRYNGCGDGSMPLIDLEDATNAVNDYLTY